MPYRLALHPVDSDYRPTDVETLIAPLQAIGLIGEPWPHDAVPRFLIGEHFLQFVTFMGCAPAIALEPPVDGGTAFCHVSLRILDDGPRLVADRTQFNPRCPRCGKRSPAWREALATWETMPRQAMSCPLCGEPSEARELDFRHGAALASTFIEIHDIHPREALPTEALFNALRTATGVDWTHAYLA